MARKLEAALPQVPDNAYRQHVIGAFHARAKEMDVPLLKLALFLDPRYRQAALSSNSSTSGGGGGSDGASSSSNSGAAAMQSLAKVQVEAGLLAQKLGYTEEEVGGLFLEMKAYAHNRAPYNIGITNPETYWMAVIGSNNSSSSTVNNPQLLASIATRLLEIKPTATTPEQVYLLSDTSGDALWVQCRLSLQFGSVPAP